MSQANPTVAIETNLGTMKLELYPDKAPETVKNFLQYVDDGFYNGTIFHRVINGFMIQCGGMGEDMRQKPTRATIQNEADNGLKNEKATVAMARTSAPHSASSQFFINHKDNDFLNYQGPHNYGYAVFGKIVDGLDVMETIAKTETGSRMGHSDVPKTAIVISSVTRL